LKLRGEHGTPEQGIPREAVFLFNSLSAARCPPLSQFCQFAAAQRCDRYRGILLQKSFCTGDQKFCGLQVRLSRKDVRDLIASR
jgi:hypothetical protein